MREAPKEAYPLTWPDGQKRTIPYNRMPSRFEMSFGRSRDLLIDELARLSAIDVILSTNIPLRRDGLPYADAREPNDPGVAVYFNRWPERLRNLKDKVPYVIACDHYQDVRSNVRAIGATVEALRTIERHGSSAMLEQAFRGFAALPAPIAADPPWWEVLGCEVLASRDEITARRNELAYRHHPDKGGDADAMARINRAFETAMERLS